MNHETSGEICIINIGPRQRQWRMRYGVVSFGVAVVIGAMMVATEVSAAWRLWLLLPFWIGAIGVYQARGKT